MTFSMNEISITYRTYSFFHSGTTILIVKSEQAAHLMMNGSSLKSGTTQHKSSQESSEAVSKLASLYKPIFKDS